MFEINESNEKISFTFAAVMANVNRIIEESHIFFHQLDIGTSEMSNLNLVLRELVNNAIEHGSHSIADKKIQCDIEHLGKKRFKIIVEDEGEGFDHQAIDWEIPLDPRQTRNRGFALINTFADQIKFNESGNRSTVFMSLGRETGFDVRTQNGFQVIAPAGDLTAVQEKSLRTLLEQMIDEGHRCYRFDFSNVGDIDSIILSVFIVFSKMIAKTGDWKLEICNLNPDLRKLFQVTRVDRIYTVIEDEGE